MGTAIGQDGTYIGVYESLSGTDFLAGIQISNDPMALALGEVYYIAASGLAITQTAATNETEAMAQTGIEGSAGRDAVLLDPYWRPWHNWCE